MKKFKVKKIKIWEEFKAFISRGSVLDMAVGVIIGTAFTAIVNALVKGILMPIISLAVPAGLDGLVTVLNPDKAKFIEGTTEAANKVVYWGVAYDKTLVNVIDWGAFINAIINFLLIALVLFTILKVFTILNNKRKAFEEKFKEEEPAPAPEEPVIPEDILLLREIRDSLKENKDKKE